MGILTPDEAWLKGFYVLVFDYGNIEDVELQAALERLWQHPLLTGCYRERSHELECQPRMAVSLDDPQLVGIAHLLRGPAPCITNVYRSSDSPCTVELSLPRSSIERHYQRGFFPFHVSEDEAVWKDEIDEWLIDIAAFVFAKQPFRVAVFGFEMMIDPELSDTIKFLIPKEHPSLLRPSDKGLEWYPENQTLRQVYEVPQTP